MDIVLSCWLCLITSFIVNHTCGASASATNRTLSGSGTGSGIRFNENYVVTWGGGHVTYLDGGNEVQLYMDQTSGIHLYTLGVHVFCL